MMLGSSHAAAASSSQRYSSSEYLPIYCADGVPALAICSIKAFVNLVFTEISTVVIVIFFHGARRTMWTASGSHQKLNSRRFAVFHEMQTSGAILPPMITNSCASSAALGSRLRTWARLVNGPPA